MGCFSTMAYDLFTFETPPAQTQCTGLVYRYRTETYIGKRGELVFKQKLIPLSKLSCKCSKCGWIPDDLTEAAYGNQAVQIAPNVVDGDLVTPTVTNKVRDWETGHLEEYVLKFVKVKDNGQETVR